jgi:hypothetical protein
MENHRNLYSLDISSVGGRVGDTCITRTVRLVGVSSLVLAFQ